MNPVYVSPPPPRSGHVDLPAFSGCRLYYELRGVQHDEKVLLIMGACATFGQLRQLADCLADSGFQVLTYDHRGIGRSSTNEDAKGMWDHLKTTCRQALSTLSPRIIGTCEDLANDAITLVNQVWGEESRFHAYGLSLGGWIAEALACQLMEKEGQDGASLKRVKSLHIHGANRGAEKRFPFSTPLKFACYLYLPKQYPTDKAENVNKTLEGCFTKEYKARTPEGGGGKNMEELWRERWLTEYEDWFPADRDRDAVAGQYAAVCNWYLDESKAASWREWVENSRQKVYVYACEDDTMIDPKDQEELANAIGAKLVRLKGGHLGEVDEDGKPRLLKPMVDNLRAAM